MSSSIMENIDLSQLYENIDTNVLAQEVENLKKEKIKLENILTELKKNNNDLKNYWTTKTSDAVFYDFEDFYKEYKISIDDLNNDIDYLEKIIGSYNEYEAKTNKEIDESIAI